MDTTTQEIMLTGRAKSVSKWAAFPRKAEISERGDAMSSYGGKELANAFRNVRKNTIQIAEDIPESKNDFVAAPEVRPVGKMLTHVAISTRIWEEVHKKKLTTLAGLNYSGLMEEFKAEEDKAGSKKEIVDLLRTEGEKFVGGKL
jgi:hypothetical protein